MISRREALAAGLTAPLLALPIAATSATRSERRAARGAPLFVADDRFVEARAAARAASKRGATIHTVSDDLTPLYDRLDRIWREHPFAVAGLTTATTFFVIERLAADRGLKTVHRLAHRQRIDGRLGHSPDGRADSPAARHTTATTAVSPDALGTALVEAGFSAAERRRITPLAAPGRDGRTLTSWLVVPSRPVGGF